jgi:anti-anti-sigma factor
MEIKLDMEGNVVVMRLQGDLVAGTAEVLKTQLARLKEKKFVHVLIDLDGVRFIDSSGLGACIAANRELDGSGGLLVCTGLNDNVRKVFSMTHADRKISVLDSRRQALDVLQEKFRCKG